MGWSIRPKAGACVRNAGGRCRPALAARRRRVPVMRGDTFVGLFTERDYARKVVLKERTSKETQVNEIMDENCELVSSSTLIKDCMNIMTDNSIRYLPVLDDNNLMGIISIGDVVKYIIEDQQFTLSQLENYINDSR